MDIPIVTYNVHKSSELDPLSWEERKPDIIELLYPYQIMGLQEVTEPVLGELLDGLPNMRAVAAWRTDGKDNGISSPILYDDKEFQLLHAEEKWLHIDPIDPSQASEFSYTIAILLHKETGSTYRVVNAYLPKGDYFNKRLAVVKLRSNLSISSSTYNMLMGCFNVDADSEAYEQLTDSYLGDSFQTTQNQCRPSISTYNTFDPENKVHLTKDYIFTDHPNVFWACIEERLKFGYYLSEHIPYYLLIRE